MWNSPNSWLPCEEFPPRKESMIKHKKKRFFKDMVGISYGIHAPLKE